MFQIDTAVVPGHPEFWDVAVGVKPEFFRAAKRLVNIQGLIAQTEKNPDPQVLDADVAPSKEWLEQALLAGHVSVVYALEQYVDLALPEKKELVGRALEDLRKVWDKEAR